MECDCSDLVPGVHHTTPEATETGDLIVASVESCDLCQKFLDDLAAAAALRDFLGGGTVMFLDGKANVDEDEEPPTVEWRGEEDVMIASETSPWIENIPNPA